MSRWDDTYPGAKIALGVATGFGLGLSRFASGTAGSLPGLPLAWALAGLSVNWQIAAALALATLAVPFCDYAEKWFRRKDDGRIVADEYLTFPLCVIGLPLQQEPLLLVVAFCFARFFDILKPWPARGLQSLSGGYGIVIDDVFASLYALAANWLFFLYALPLVKNGIARYWAF
jgi:phosphatidylglycerophosphatase A